MKLIGDNNEDFNELDSFEDEIILKYNLTRNELNILEMRFAEPKLNQRGIAKELGLNECYVGRVLKKTKIINAMVDIGRHFMGVHLPAAFNVIVKNMNDSDRDLAHKAAIDCLNINHIQTKFVQIENKETIADRVSEMTPEEAVVFLRKVEADAAKKVDYSTPGEPLDVDFVGEQSKETDSEGDGDPTSQRTDDQEDENTGKDQKNAKPNDLLLPAHKDKDDEPNDDHPQKG
jgi:hypothetical protein